TATAICRSPVGPVRRPDPSRVQPHPKNCIAHPKNCAASIPNGLFTCSPFDLSQQPTVRGLCLSSCWRLYRNDDRDRDRLLFALLRARCSAGSMGVARSHAKRDALFYKLVAALDLLTLLLRWLIGGLVGSRGAPCPPQTPPARPPPPGLPEG